MSVKAALKLMKDEEVDYVDIRFCGYDQRH